MRVLRPALIAFELLVALNALGGGIYGLAGAPGVSQELLRGGPFHSYFLPSLILLVVVGGSMWVSAALLLLRRPAGARASLLAGAILAAWIVAQIATIGFQSWLQPAMFVAALVIVGLAWMLVRGPHAGQ